MKCNICNISMNHLIKDLFQCDHCELVSSSVEPDLSLYDKSYLRKYERYSCTNIGYKINKFRLSVLLKYHNITKKILDFGCGSGSFVNECNEHGLNIKGFDINPFSQFCDITYLFNGHHTVTFWDSLEHISNPIALIKGLNSTNIIISAPSIDDFKNSDLTKWHHYYPGEHVHYFNYKSLLTLLFRCGYYERFHSYEESKYRTSGGNKNILTIVGRLKGGR